MTASSDVPFVIGWGERGRTVALLDQSRLPEQEVVRTLTTPEQVADAIATLKVRGAPAIGVAGALGLAIGIETFRDRDGNADALEAEVARLHDLLLNTRPTGRNLAWALGRVRSAALGSGPVALAAAAAIDEADRILAEDAELCRRIGEAGVELLPGGSRVLTHCNAGALATAGRGTALAPIYEALRLGRSVEAFACETRPVLQGARLTAWELSRAGVPVTVLTDSMAGALMARGAVDLVIVGADAVAANGDVANKIGTYGLAVLAREHGLPFYVAAPAGTFDASLGSGAEVPIEQRDPDEVRGPAGRRTVPGDARIWNPAFDVTPAHLVTAFITDRGLLRPPYGPPIRELFGTAGESSQEEP